MEDSNNYNTWIQKEWVKELYKEFQTICRVRKIKLGLPLIEIVQISSSYGIWDGLLRKIKISASLIQEQSWDIVISVLMHEMAHQLVSEDPLGIIHKNLNKKKTLSENFIEGDHFRAHGPAFQLACELLGVPHFFRSATCDLGRTYIMDWRNTGLASAHPVLEKAKKLLALAQSANEHEASLAMRKVHELYEKYNLERLQQDEKSHYVYCIINHEKQRIEAHQSAIASLLNEFYFVQVIFSTLYHPQDQMTYKTIEILGDRENVLVAEYVYYFLLRTVEYMWSVYKTENQLSSQYKRSYLLGLIKGFRSRLLSQKHSELFQQSNLTPRGESDLHPNSTISKISEGNSISLIHQKQLIADEARRLDAFVHQRFPNLVSRSSSGANVYTQVFETGQRDGLKITIHKSLNQRETNTGKIRFLTHSN